MERKNAWKTYNDSEKEQLKHLIVVFNKADLIEDKQKENVLAKQ